MTSLVQANVTFQGSITSLGTFGQTTYAPADLGVNSLSLKTGNLTSLVTTTSSAPTGFAAAGEGALVFPGTANAYISFGTTGQPFSNSNIYAFGDFVVEAWVNPVSLSNNPNLFGMGDPVTAFSWMIQAYTGSTNFYSVLNGVTSYLQVSAALPLGTWTHLAIIHQSASKRVQVYFNGQPQALAAGGGFSASGTVGTYTTGIIPVTNQQISIGQVNGTSYVYNGSLTNLRVTTGSGAMYLYNNNAFTPSTTPLFPASNTAGGSLTTRLLVRVPLATNKMVVPKLGGQNCNTVLAFPPAPMTGYATNMTGQSYYGGGVYVASASTEASTFYAWTAFDKSASTFWNANFSYTTNVPYGGTVRTVDVNGASYAGEWLQIQKPSSIVLANYALLTQSGAVNTPGAWYVLGSRDGSNWFLIDQRSGATWTAGVYNTYQVQSSQAFNYFRIVVNVVSTNTGLSIAEWTLNGSIEGPSISADGRLGIGITNPTRALEVAGDVVCGGTVSSGNPITFKNALYNGDFRIAQRGASFSLDQYTLDRWWASSHAGSGGTATITQIQSGLANFSNAIQIASTSTTNGNFWLSQSLETRDVVRFQGQPVTVSFWYRIPVSFTGTWTANLVWSTAVDTKIINTSVSYTVAGSSTLPNTTAWTYVSFQAFVPLTAQALAILIVTTGNTVNGAQFQVTGVQLEKGSVATGFETRPYATELALCMRYYEQSYTYGTVPGTNVSTGLFTSYGSTNGAGDQLIFCKYSVPKRTPAVVFKFYSASGTADVWNIGRSGFNGTSALFGATQYSSESQFGVYVSFGGSYPHITCLTNGHWVANAEL